MRKSVLVALSLVGVVTAIACASKAPGFINAEPDGGPHVDGGVPDGAVAPGDAGLPDATTTVDGSTPDPGYTSGSRLRARVYTSSDGAEQFIDWYDNVRKEECYFRTAADGVDRCLPSGAGASYYGDASCTQLLGYQSSGCSAPAYIAWNEPPSTACGQYRGHVYPAGAKTVPSALYMKGATCTATGLGPSFINAFDWYSLGAEVPASSFQGATITVK